MNRDKLLEKISEEEKKLVELGEKYKQGQLQLERLREQYILTQGSVNSLKSLVEEFEDKKGAKK